MNEPHGGRLVNLIATGERARALEAEARKLPVIRLNAFELSDLEMLAIGAFSPLRGFMKRADYESVVRDMRFAGGLAWSLPITLAVSAATATEVRDRNRVAMADSDGVLLAVMDVEDVFAYDRELEAGQIFQTTETAHPGVAYLHTRG